MGSEAKVKATRSHRLGKHRISPSKIKSVDFILLLVTLILVAFGLIMVFSSSYYYSISKTGSPFTYLIRDGIWVIMGLGLMLFGSMVDYRKYNNRTFVLIVLGLCLVLLILVLTPAGTEINYASRWITLGPITIMPGEISKMGMILLIAWFFSDKPARSGSLLFGILPIVVVMLLFSFLILMQPNLSTAITLCGITVAMMLVAGMRWLYVIIITGGGIAGILTLVLNNPGYWGERFTGFLDPFGDTADSSYQIVQSLLALGSGELFGVGLGKSVQKSLYLPEPQNDFILAIIGEELGFAGILLLILAYSLFLWRGTRIAIKAQDQFGMLLASGVVIMVAIQVILNIAVVTSSMPATGINLPFISYGGNALMIFMFMTGVMLNISRHEPEKAAAAKAASKAAVEVKRK